MDASRICDTGFPRLSFFIEMISDKIIYPDSSVVAAASQGHINDSTAWCGLSCCYFIYPNIANDCKIVRWQFSPKSPHWTSPQDYSDLTLVPSKCVAIWWMKALASPQHGMHFNQAWTPKSLRCFYFPRSEIKKIVTKVTYSITHILQIVKSI